MTVVLRVHMLECVCGVFVSEFDYLLCVKIGRQLGSDLSHSDKVMLSNVRWVCYI